MSLHDWSLASALVSTCMKRASKRKKVGASKHSRLFQHKFARWQTMQVHCYKVPRLNGSPASAHSPTLGQAHSRVATQSA